MPVARYETIFIDEDEKVYRPSQEAYTSKKDLEKAIMKYVALHGPVSPAHVKWYFTGARANLASNVSTRMSVLIDQGDLLLNHDMLLTTVF